MSQANACRGTRLFRVILNDEVLFHGEVHIGALRHSRNGALELVSVQRKPLGNGYEHSVFTGQLAEEHGRLAALSDGDHLTGFYLIGRNIDLLSVNGKMTVGD